MYKKLTYLLFAAALALLCSCKKDPPVKIITNTTPPSSGKYLLFDADEAFNIGLSAIPSLYTSIYYSNLDGTNITRITPVEPAYYSYRPSWSPDGKQVLFTHGDQFDTDRSICIIDIDGSNFKSVVKGNKADYASFSPDGTKLVYAKSLVDSIPYKYDVYVSNRDGTSEKRLTNFANDNGAVANIHWSSDGKIYFNGVGDHSKIGIYSINEDGTNLNYVMTDVYFLAMSPDGKHILYDLGSGIYICNSDGSNIKTIMTFDNNNPNMLIGASWSTDGSQIFFSNADYPANFGIFRLNSDGSGLKKMLVGYYEFPAVF
jgi:TolB protein